MCITLKKSLNYFKITQYLSLLLLNSLSWAGQVTITKVGETTAGGGIIQVHDSGTGTTTLNTCISTTNRTSSTPQMNGMGFTCGDGEVLDTKTYTDTSGTTTTITGKIQQCPSDYTVEYCNSYGPTDQFWYENKWYTPKSTLASASKIVYVNGVKCGCPYLTPKPKPSPSPVENPCPVGYAPWCCPDSTSAHKNGHWIDHFNQSVLCSSAKAQLDSTVKSKCCLCTTPSPSPVVPNDMGILLKLDPPNYDFGVVNEFVQNKIFVLSNLTPNAAKNCHAYVSTGDFKIVNFNQIPFSPVIRFEVPGNSTISLAVAANPILDGVMRGVLSVDCEGAFANSQLVVTKNPPPSPSPSPQQPNPGVSPSPSPIQGNCPPRYEVWKNGGLNLCRPQLPMKKGRNVSDFIRNADGYPVCGKGRIPVTANGSPLSVSTSDVPNSDSKVVFDGVAYLYAIKDSKNNPIYLYEDGMTCACAHPIFSPSTPTTTPIELENKVYPDGLSKIRTQNSMGTVEYSPVAFGKSNLVDGRTGSGYLMCGCPNINEEMVQTDMSLSGSTPQGAICKPILRSKKMVLVDYDPELHEKQIKNPMVESDPTTGKLITDVLLPVESGKDTVELYKRKVWACTLGYAPDYNSKLCAVPFLMHQCSKSDPTSKMPPSATSGVAKKVSIQQLDRMFDQAVNKKLACCTNDISKGHKNFKFDCLENQSQSSDFNSLWVSKDPDQKGGQLNAVALQGNGKQSSGFFTIKGAPCSEFSEFGGELLMGRIDPEKNQVLEEKGKLPLPMGIAYDELKAKIGKGVPETVADRVRCPILIRAAMKVECGENDPLPAIQKSVDYVNEGVKERHCTSAKNIEIHYEVRQVTELVGKPVMKTETSISKPNAVNRISIKSIIDAANGGECPPTTKRVGDQCISI